MEVKKASAVKILGPESYYGIFKRLVEGKEYLRFSDLPLFDSVI